MIGYVNRNKSIDSLHMQLIQTLDMCIIYKLIFFAIKSPNDSSTSVLLYFYCYIANIGQQLAPNVSVIVCRLNVSMIHIVMVQSMKR